jgi:hypothetical protein
VTGSSTHIYVRLQILPVPDATLPQDQFPTYPPHHLPLSLVMVNFRDPGVIAQDARAYDFRSRLASSLIHLFHKW